MSHQDIRTRVTFFIPVTCDAEEQALDDIVEYLQAQWDQPVSVTGFTHSQASDADTIFDGFWLDPDRKTWLSPEGVVLFVIDYPYADNDPNLKEAIGRLRTVIDTQYELNGSKQKEIWIATQPVTLYK